MKQLMQATAETVPGGTFKQPRAQSMEPKQLTSQLNAVNGIQMQQPTGNTHTLLVILLSYNIFIQKQQKGSQQLVKGGLAGIQLPPMQGKAQAANGGGAESMYDATGQLKIRTLQNGPQQQHQQMLNNANSMNSYSHSYIIL